jgi:3D-(3,5/4)-trihydroxycyclohexane-1,2-dione acylhydrolase (decyclizing)
MARLTAAQALIRFLAAQQVERDGVERRFFEGCFGIFGHGNVAGIGQALYQDPGLLTYYQARNEQAMVHTAVGFARMRNRLATLACTTSIGPGATNLVTGAALATVNRLPVLLLPGDVFASRRPDPVLQQLEVPSRGDVSVNDSLQPVSRYFDRIERPEQVMPRPVRSRSLFRRTCRRRHTTFRTTSSTAASGTSPGPSPIRPYWRKRSPSFVRPTGR